MQIIDPPSAHWGLKDPCVWEEAMALARVEEISLSGGTLRAACLANG